MNRKLLYTQTDETFEIQRNHFGYRIFKVIAENEAKAVSGYYANAGDLMEGLAELAIFSNDDLSALSEIAENFRAIKQSLTDYFTTHCW